MSKELSAQELCKLAEGIYLDGANQVVINEFTKGKYNFIYDLHEIWKQAYEKQAQEIEKAIDDKINKICTLYIRNSSCKECKREIEELCPAKPFIELKQTILSKGVVK